MKHQMGSRLRHDVKHFFECFCEVVGPKNNEIPSWIIQKFPESYKDESVLKSVPKFTFPCEFDKSVVQHYSFVLTNVDSKWTFGFCRHDPKSETALVVLTFLPWHEAFVKFLNYISDVMQSPYSGDLWKFLDSVYESKIPRAGWDLVAFVNQTFKCFTCEAPNEFKLPSIPENRNLTEYYNAVDNHNMMVIFASMLFERRIIFTSKKLYRLSACVQSANSLLYPMSWQHIFIPVLPQALIDYLLAPMPYLIGLPNSLLTSVRQNDLGEVVLLDADNNTVKTPFRDLESLPSDIVNSLQKHLRNRATLLGDGVSKAFLRAIVQLIGGYRDALKISQGKKITFCEKSFVESRPVSMQPFLTKMLELQIFQQFIEERLELLNAGLGFSDEFELEVCNYLDRSNSKMQQYKEWVHTMKKEGSAFIKTVKNRTNPAVKSAVRTVKDRGRDVRSAYKGIRLKLKEKKDSKPSSAPNSPTASRSMSDIKNISGSSNSSTSNMDYRDETVVGPFQTLNNTASDSPSRSNEDLVNLNIDLMADMHDVIFRNFSIVPPDGLNSNTNRAHDNTTDMVVNRKKRENRSKSATRNTIHAVNLFTTGTEPKHEFLNSDHDNDSYSENDDENVFKCSVSNFVSPSKSETVVHQEQTKDLIQLGSTSSMADFDPLYNCSSSDESSSSLPRSIGLMNPLYQYYNHSPQSSSSLSANKQKDTTADNLLSEYGIDFSKLKLYNNVNSSNNNNDLDDAINSQKSRLQWTKFDA